MKRGGTAQGIPQQLQDLRKLRRLEYIAQDDLEQYDEAVNTREQYMESLREESQSQIISLLCRHSE